MGEMISFHRQVVESRISDFVTSISLGVVNH